MIWRDHEGKLTQDSQAALAIRGLRADGTQGTVDALESDYRRWLGVTVDDEGLVASTSWRTGKLMWILNHLAPFHIFRKQITVLAISYGRAQATINAHGQQQNIVDQFNAVIQGQRDLRTFLFIHHKVDLDRADTINLPLTTLAMQILARQLPK